ncbi:stabilizer of axonemal microtubules 4 isoform X3 [Columba livia]|uniref:stabilizer of axonemal microtubules 4 isoform X3 n=1 Tax=Columba livia TaxID=8932 RepID=UPI0031BB2D21
MTRHRISCSPVTRHRAGYQETVPAGTFRSLRELLGDSPTMASVCPFVSPRPRVKLRSSARGQAGGSTDIMNFYATTYGLAYGQPCFRPRLGHHTGAGFVSNYRSDVPSLLRSCGTAECQDSISAATEHFQPHWHPDGRGLLPRHLHQPPSGYHQESLPCCLCAGGVSPQHRWHHQDVPKSLGECGGGCTKPDILQKTSIGATEPSGFTKALLRGDNVLPALSTQPLGVSVTKTDYLPSVRSRGDETLPELSGGSERGSGFTREVPSVLGTVDLPVVGHAVRFVSRGLRVPRGTQDRLLGRQKAGRMEPSGFTTNNGQYVPPRATMSPTAPARCWRDPNLMARPMGGIQPLRPSGFSTNNHPTGVGDAGGQPPG